MLTGLRAHAAPGARAAAALLVVAAARIAPAVLTTLAVLALTSGPARAGVLVVGKRAPVARTCVRARTHAKGRGRRTCRTARAAAPAPAPRPAPAAPPGPWYQNPVSGEAADPFAQATSTSYYLYSTGDLFPIERSTDLVHWTSAGSAFTRRPNWVVQSGDWHPWSPSVIEVDRPCQLSTVVDDLLGGLKLGLSCFYMYYVGLSAQFNTNCLAVATSVTPDGPFVDQGPLGNGALDAAGRPVGCGDDAGYGNIDPAPFLDSDGAVYVYVSTDFACPAGIAACTAAESALRPTISVMRLDPSLLAVTGRRQPLFAGAQAWERAAAAMVVEGPSMQKRDGVYHLFYSGGDWTGSYGMGDATLAGPLGPVIQDPANPILSGTAAVTSPGGGSPVIGPHGGDWMLYHARMGGREQPRQLFIDPIGWSTAGMPTITGPSATPQSPVP